jgi:hypothetical protein
MKQEFNPSACSEVKSTELLSADITEAQQVCHLRFFRQLLSGKESEASFSSNGGIGQCLRKRNSILLH